MQFALPENHGLPEPVVQSQLIHSTDGAPSITNIQHAALEAGVGRGVNIVAIAPTSSGKTEIGLLAASRWLLSPQVSRPKVVYLTSHRALARQKHGEFIDLFVDPGWQSRQDIVLAIGDLITDGDGVAPNDPLDATFLIATYEKFLGLLSTSGLREDMTHYCFVCDEIQLINDQSRGASVEILLALVKQAGFGHLVGLSAVMATDDSVALTEWLGAKLVSEPTREVPITYELRTPRSTYVVNTETPTTVDERPPSTHHDTLSILRETATGLHHGRPVAVFCMRRRDVFDLAKAWAREVGVPEGGPEEIPPEFIEITSSAEDLACYVPYDFGFHTADLIDEERAYVEQRLDDGALSVVFSTTTLAMGLNYSFRTVIFDRWWRYQFARRQDEPIPRSEFHNIAGRAGRLGRAEEGKVIYSATQNWQLGPARQFLKLDEFDAYQPRITPDRFDQLALQLIAAGIVQDFDSLFDLIQNTFSARTELEVNASQPDYWKQRLLASVEQLTEWGFVQSATT